MKSKQIRGEDSIEKNDTKSRSKETSILFEPYVDKVLLFFLLLGIMYKFKPLIIASTFLLSLFVLVTLWKRVSLKNLVPDIKLSKSKIFPGEDFWIQACVYNGKLLPLVWLEWNFAEYRGIRLGDGGEEMYLIRFLWLLWFRKVEWKIKAKAIHRGVYDFGKIKLCSGDGFRFTEIEKTYNLNKKVYVYPRIVPVSVGEFRSSMEWNAMGKEGGFIEDPLLISGIREYQDGDELRRLNWGATARTGKLQTNIYQPVETKQLLIYMDVQGFMIKKDAYEDPKDMLKYIGEKKESFEEFLSIIASLTVKYVERNISLGFSSNSLDYLGNQMDNIFPSSNLAPILDQLAACTQRVTSKDMIVLEEILYKIKSPIPVFIYCHHVSKAHYDWYQRTKHEFNDINFYYKMETKYAKKLGPEAKSMDSFLS